MAGAATHLVFMYGTLKATEANHKVLFSRDPSGVSFKGEGQTLDLYPLVVTTPFNIPFLLQKENTGKVRGTPFVFFFFFPFCLNPICFHFIFLGGSVFILFSFLFDPICIVLICFCCLSFVTAKCAT